MACNYGCPLANLAQEMSPIDEGFRVRIEAALDAWRDGITDAPLRGQGAGQLRTDIDSHKPAAFIVASIEGTASMAKDSQDPSMVETCMDDLVLYHLHQHSCGFPPDTNMHTGWYVSEDSTHLVRAERYGRWVVKWRWPVLVSVLALSFLATAGARRLGFIDEYRVFFGRDNITGMAMLNNAFQESAMKDMATLVPTMYLVITLTIVLLLRSVSATIPTLGVIALSVTSALGIAGWADLSLTPPSTGTPVRASSTSRRAVVLGTAGLWMSKQERSLVYRERMSFSTGFGRTVTFSSIGHGIFENRAGSGYG